MPSDPCLEVSLPLYCCWILFLEYSDICLFENVFSKHFYAVHILFSYNTIFIISDGHNNHPPFLIFLSEMLSRINMVHVQWLICKPLKLIWRWMVTVYSCTSLLGMVTFKLHIANWLLIINEHWNHCRLIIWLLQ